MSKTFEIFSLIFIFILLSLIFVFSIQEKTPTRSLIKFFGLVSFFLLSLSLIFGPLAVIWPNHFIKLLELRKTVGVAAFIFVLGHIFLTMQNYFGWNLAKAAASPGVLPGILASVVLFVLTITSFGFLSKLLEPKVWKGIHYFNYLAFALSFYHFLLKASGPNQIFSYNYLEFFLILFGGLAIVLQIAGFVTRLKRN